MSLLENIKSPADLKKIAPALLPDLAQEIRERILNVTSENGGHVGPNLGVVELTIALHRVFDTPTDNFVFDVSHQSYVHKLLTGRNDTGFDKLRQSGGVSGFFNRNESPHDAFGAGHAGTALSAALGIAIARDLRETNEHVVALIGDAALTCGITMEALNNIATSTRRLIIILNDNEWAIDKNIGAIAKHLNRLITTPIYNETRSNVKKLLSGSIAGENILKLAQKLKRDTKEAISKQASLFEKYQLRYIGPIDGHDIELLTNYLEFCKKSTKPIVLHVRTIKGKGCEMALRNPEKFHGLSPFKKDTGESHSAAKNDTAPHWQNVFGKTLVQCAKKNPKIIGLTAAMPSGTSLNLLKQELPKQFYDVGIAEEHAVIFAAGLATKGFKPVCAIYSTFLQRAYDMVLHDICLQNLDVTFCIDRAGVSPNDGPTHHGLFDIAFLRHIPRAIIMQPKDEDELADMIFTAIEHDGPAFVRYPRGNAFGVKIKDAPEKIPLGKSEILRAGNDIVLWALGNFVPVAMALAEKLEKTFPISVGVTNARFAKPLDIALLEQQATSAKLIVTLEDHVITGGFGSGVIEHLQTAKIMTPVERIGWPDKFIPHGTSTTELREKHELSENAIFEKIAARLNR